MKQVFTFLTIFLVVVCHAQVPFVTASSIDHSFIQPASYKMKWLIEKDSTKNLIGEIYTDLFIKGDQVYIVQKVQLKNATGEWIDSTIAYKKDLRPIYHSSYNPQRNMTLRYGGGIVTGFYKENQTGTETRIADNVQGLYFDSNIYPHLIAWLPLKKGYTAKIPVYNFADPKSKGVLSVTITGVDKGEYICDQDKVVKVYVVNVTDEISNLPSRYFIGEKDRKLYRISIQTPKGNMLMQLDGM